ncbi:protein TIC 62, chloroplastic isoform X2 [Argentina anserina]|uniref:protein TIC 62, chloroplastic isoform X2 n=1 Tax=Argentina anserina TaxID=57926 RepID=UPI00217624CE|nr:protein TIC 62, chloroplastic isoform X2 [Potentilla anserina]
MEACSLQSPTVTTVPSSLSHNGFKDNPFLRGQLLKVSNSKRYPNVKKLGLLRIKAQASGMKNSSSESVEEVRGRVGLKDANVVFVAGATGKVGSRAVRELLKLGFQVRAGVRSAQRAATLVQSVKQMKFDVESAGQGSQPVEKLEIVECDLEKEDQIGPALGSASVVLCCIGASEKEIFDITGPYRIDYMATKNLIEAATVAKVNHFILLTSLGTNKVGFPAAILNLFWGVLIWKRKAEEALIASGLPYTIVRPGGMERPTDAFKETHNITLAREDTLFGGLVSNLQVAELMASIAKNPGLSYFKVLEVVAETTAPLTPLEKLLAKIPSQRAYSPKEFGGGGDAAAASAPKSSQSITSEKPSTPIEKEPAKEVPVKHASSPYIAYEDLKPPTSPTPSAPKATPSQEDSKVISEEQTNNAVSSASVNEKSSPSQEVLITQPLSPYFVYEDFKPPSSPCPTPAGPKKIEPSAPVEVVSQSSGGSDATASICVSPQNSTHSHSPYHAYDDFKPPSSPSPSPPTTSLLSTPTAGMRT